MGSAAADHLTTLELCHVSPASLTFPLTHFDLQWFHTSPVSRLFFYALPPQNSTPEFFTSVLLPNLKLSLSAALSRFLPLAASLTWPSHSPKPFLLYTTGVPLTVAQSAVDFNHIASNIGETRDATASHPYVPVLPTSDSEASALAVQITLFPNQGFCVGMATHHGVVDGKSATMFLKAWAHLSKNDTLPEELTPFLDRSIVPDPDGLGLAYVKSRAPPGPRSLKLKPPPYTVAPASSLVRATFLLSQERIQTLRQTATSSLNLNNNNNNNNNKKIRLSSFVVTLAHSIVCMAKAKALAGVFLFGFLADARARLDPPLPANYFGNCVIDRSELIEVEPLLAAPEGGGGVGFAVERISGMIDEVEENGVSGGMATSSFRSKLEASRGVFIAVAGYPGFHVYSADFGWGKPKYVEMTSIDRTGAISLADSRDGSRGIEVGLALTVEEMGVFRSAFAG